jgi:phosphate transport system substrate-binding protein
MNQKRRSYAFSELSPIEAFVGMILNVMPRLNIDLPTLLTAGGLVVTVVGWLIGRYWTRRKLTYRVHLDTPISMTPHHTRDMVDLKFQRAGREVPDASLALLRVKNGGGLDIKREDIERPLTFTFKGREVIGFEIPEAKPLTLKEMILEDPGPMIRGDRITLPKIPLNKRDRFKLLVLLSGAGTAVKGDGYISGGRVARDAPRGGPSTRSLLFGGVFLALVGLLAGLLIRPVQSGAPGPVRCLSGSLTVEGSSAFTPLVKDLSLAYEKTCAHAQIDVQGVGSLEGILDLANSQPADRATLIAVSDGRAPEESSALTARPIGIVVFAVVVNKRTGITQLTLDQLRGIYHGRYRNWKQLGGRDQPISIVSRDSQSGTRRAFEARILNGTEPAVSSNDCRRKDRDAAAVVVRCERRTTVDLLSAVNSIPGAIGYAEATASSGYDDVDRVQLDGRDPDSNLVLQGKYSFWTVEYFYTYGPPEPGTLLSAFLEYMNTDTAQNTLRRLGDVPCVDRQQDLTSTLCRQ